MATTSVTAPPSAPPDALALFASGATELPAVFHHTLTLPCFESGLAASKLSSVYDDMSHDERRT
jgi:hypothetical protein